jgi:hypothetical protein
MKGILTVLTAVFPAILLLAVAPASAESCYPFQIGIAPPAQLVPKEKSVCGLRLSLVWGDNRTVQGLDAGLLNTTEEIRGIEIAGIVNQLQGGPDARGEGSWGVQAAGIMNANSKTSFIGVQVAGIVNYHDDARSTGAQLATLFNLTSKSRVQGIQAALLSNENDASEVDGLQLAMFNHARKFTGLQLGLGNGVTAAEGMVAMVVVPVDVVLAAGGANTGLPPYRDPKAREASEVNGVQLGVFANFAEVTNGLQTSIFFNGTEKSLNGVQISLFNNLGSEPTVQGFQLGDANFSGDMTGLQIGLVNFAGKVKGLQIGAVNICKDLSGIQIGAFNIVRNRFPDSVFFTPVVNVGF